MRAVRLPVLLSHGGEKQMRLILYTGGWGGTGGIAWRSDLMWKCHWERQIGYRMEWNWGGRVLWVINIWYGKSVCLSGVPCTYQRITSALDFICMSVRSFSVGLNINQLNFLKCPRWIGQDNRQSSKKNNKYQLLYTYGCTSWWWAYLCPKHVEVDDT